MKLEVHEGHMTNDILSHAKHELELIGEEPETIDGYLRIIQAFDSMGHSGGSASIAIPIVHELLQQKNLTPLTDNPEEWLHHDQHTTGSVTKTFWQNRRNSAAFSKDAGKTYYLVSEKKRRFFARRIYKTVTKAS